MIVPQTRLIEQHTMYPAETPVEPNGLARRYIEAHDSAPPTRDK
jgi:hypothetical protein